MKLVEYFMPNRQFVRFVIAGCLNTLLTYGSFLLLLRVMHYLYAYTLTCCMGVVIAYYLQTVFVFKIKFRVSAVISFPLVYVAQYFLGLGTLSICVEFFHISPSISGIISIILVVPVTFLLSRFVLTSSRCSWHRKK